LRGVEARLDYIAELGASAIWLSPIYPSPLADFGYDVSDYTGIDPVFGTFERFDELLNAAHERGLRLLMDLVPSHTSIEHPWFREHPDWYIWAPGDDPLVGEVYMRSALVKPYLDYLDSAFAFELYHSPWDAEALRGAITRTLAAGSFAWVLSNHDFPRLATRYGPQNTAAAAVL